MNLRLAYIIGQLSVGGAEQQLYHLLSGLDRSYFSPLVITLGPIPNEYWKPRIAELDIPVQHVPRVFSRALRTLRIATILRSVKTEIVHSWSFHTNPYAAVAGRLAGVTLRLGSMRENYGLITDRMVRRLGYVGLDALTTNSRTAARQVKEFALTKAPVRFVANGIAISERVSQEDHARLKSELGFSDNHILLGTIARLDGNKNHAMLLRAFAPLTKRWPDLRLVIIGDGQLKTRLSGIAKELGILSRVSFLGEIPLAARYLPAMHVCCLSSYTEGMPNLVMEAMAAGVPVVSTRCGDTVDLVEHGVSGYLVSADDDANMSRYLDVLLGKPEQRLQMGQAGRQKMRDEFSVTQMVTRMTQFYEELLVEGKLASIINPYDAPVP